MLATSSSQLTSSGWSRWICYNDERKVIMVSFVSACAFVLVLFLIFTKEGNDWIRDMFGWGVIVWLMWRYWKRPRLYLSVSPSAPKDFIWESFGISMNFQLACRLLQTKDCNKNRGVPDGLIEEGDESIEGYTDDETLKDIMDCFMRCMVRASKSGGLFYCDGMRWCYGTIQDSYWYDC